MAFPDICFEDLIPLNSSLTDTPTEVRRQIERDALYATYIQRQKKEIDLLKKDEGLRIPGDFDFASLAGLSNELKTKILAARPETMAQAARIDGMTPAALTLILARVKRGVGKKSA